MRTRLFRASAGVLAALFTWYLATADLSARPAREVAGAVVVATTFALFALFGAEPAERLLAEVFGVGSPGEPRVKP